MISVIIPTADRASLLSQALGSVAAQTYQDLEVIVINDGGEPVEATLHSWRDRLPITLIDLSGRYGPASARNAGIENAAGRYLAFLDDDDLFLPNHLQAAYDAMQSGLLDFVYLGALVSTKRIQTQLESRPTRNRKAYPFNERFLYVANYLHTGSVVVDNFRHTAVRLDETLYHCEDWDLWLKLRNELNYRIGFVNQISSIYHRVTGESSIVTAGQAETPSPFSVAHEYLYQRWPTTDHTVQRYRAWMREFDAYCDECNSNNREVPSLVFDYMLSYLYPRFSNGLEPQQSVIPRFFEQPNPSSLFIKGS